MTILTIFETCRPRADVLKRAITESDFTAVQDQVITGVVPLACLRNRAHALPCLVWGTPAVV